MSVQTIAKSLITMLMIGGVIMNTYAQDKVEASIGADVVSRYIWRGQDLGGVSIQPEVSVGYKGLSLSAWGNIGIQKPDVEDGYDLKELDLTLSYGIGGFSVSITDYFTEGGEGYFMYDAHRTSHVLEAQTGYDFGWMAVNWHTNIAGADGMNKDGNRAYSSYLSVAAPFTLGGLDWTVEAGAVPWSTDFYNDPTNGFSVCHLSLEASKEIKITEHYSLPLFAQIAFNPRTENAYFTFGLSF